MARGFAHTLVPKNKVSQVKTGRGKPGTDRRKHNKAHRYQIQPRFLLGIDRAEGQSG